MPEPHRDLTFVFYDNEEVGHDVNGLGRLVRNHPDWLRGDFAILMEPTDGVIEGGCQGVLTVQMLISGHRAHAARSWLGKNAIHGAADVLNKLTHYVPREPEIEGAKYREGMNAVQITGGTSRNVIPDACTIVINYRFAPDRSQAEAEAHIREMFPGHSYEVLDFGPAARPGFDTPAVAAFIAAMKHPVRAKYGWTDVSRFADLGVPAVNYGPGDPNLAHTREEHVELAAVIDAETRMRDWLQQA